MAKKKFDIDQGFHQLDEILQSFPVKKSNFQRLSNYILKE